MEATLNQTVGVSGQFRCVVKDKDGNIKTDTGYFDNLITNGGLDRLMTSANCVWYAHVGTGSSTPDVTQTQLTTFLASRVYDSNGTRSNLGSPTYEVTKSVQFSFALGAITGNITEIGTSWGSTGTSGLFSRTLILDGSQNPTSLTITSNDQLIIYYTLKILPPVADSVQIVNIGGVDTTVTIRPQRINGGFLSIASAIFYGSGDYADYRLFNYSHITTGSYYAYVAGSGQTLPAITNTTNYGTSFGSYPANSYASSVATYTPGTFFRDYTITLESNAGNVSGGISLFQSAGISVGIPALIFAAHFNPPIAKDATKRLTLTFRQSVART